MMIEKGKWIKNQYVVAALAILCALLWGSATPTVKLGYSFFEMEVSSAYDKMLFAGIRFLLAGIVIIIVMSVIKKRFLYPQKRRNIPKIILLGLTFTGMQYLFYYIGLSNTSGSKSAILLGAATFFTIILSSVFYKNDKLNARKIIGCLLGFSGVVIINLKEGLGGLNLTLHGEGFLIIASLFFAIGSIISKWILNNNGEDSSVIAGYQLFIGGLFLIITGWIGRGYIPVITPEGILMTGYLVALSSVAYTIWMLLLRSNRVSSVTIYHSFVPVFGVILSGVILSENVLNWRSLLALVMVCSAIYIVNSE